MIMKRKQESVDVIRKTDLEPVNENKRGCGMWNEFFSIPASGIGGWVLRIKTIAG